MAFGTTEIPSGKVGFNCPICGQPRIYRVVEAPSDGWSGGAKRPTMAEVCVNPACAMCYKDKK